MSVRVPSMGSTRCDNDTMTRPCSVNVTSPPECLRPGARRTKTIRVASKTFHQDRFADLVDGVEGVAFPVFGDSRHRLDTLLLALGTTAARISGAARGSGESSGWEGGIVPQSRALCSERPPPPEAPPLSLPAMCSLKSSPAHLGPARYLSSSACAVADGTRRESETRGSHRRRWAPGEGRARKEMTAATVCRTAPGIIAEPGRNPRSHEDRARLAGNGALRLARRSRKHTGEIRRTRWPSRFRGESACRPAFPNQGCPGTAHAPSRRGADALSSTPFDGAKHEVGCVDLAVRMRVRYTHDFALFSNTITA